MCEHSSKIRAALERGAQIDDVALIPQRRPDRPVEVRHSDKSVDGKTAPSQVVEPAREQHREPTVAVDVGRRPELVRHEREDPVVERVDDIAHRRRRDRVEILPRHVHLDATADSSQNRRNGDVVAGAINVAIAHKDMEDTLPCGFGVRGLGQISGCVRVQVLGQISGCHWSYSTSAVSLAALPIGGERGHRCARRRRGLELNRKRPLLPRERRDDDEDLRSGRSRRCSEARAALLHRDRDRLADSPETIFAAIGCSRPLRIGPTDRQGHTDQGREGAGPRPPRRGCRDGKRGIVRRSVHGSPRRERPSLPRGRTTAFRSARPVDRLEWIEGSLSPPPQCLPRLPYFASSPTTRSIAEKCSWSLCVFRVSMRIK